MSQIFLEPLEVVCFVFLMGVIGCHVDGIQAIETHAPLKAGPCLVSDEAQHLDFLDQIIHALMNMGESADLSSGQMGGSCHQVFVFRPQGQFISKGG